MIDASRTGGWTLDLNALMRRRKHDICARAVLSAAALLPYWRFLSLGVVYVPDDMFASDLFNGELPGRALIGRLIAAGDFPVWTNQLCSGLPLAGAPLDPVGTALFALFPPARALDILVVLLLLVAGHGAYSLARRLGTDRLAAILGGIAFAGCGYLASQLRHLAIVSTVVWLPFGLVLIDKTFAAARKGGGPLFTVLRAGPAVLFGLVFAIQILAGFPQSAYICALAYMGFGATLCIRDARARGIRQMMPPAVALTTAAAAAVGIGAILLLPLNALAALSDRATTSTYLWATDPPYWPPNILNFFTPYYFGDISDNTYRGGGLFWEDYGYLGFAPVVLAFYGVARERPRAALTFFKIATIVAYLFVLGSATPVFHIAYTVVPGLDRFRFPTRFLIVVDLGIAMLAAVGLCRIRRDLSTIRGGGSITAASIAAAIILITSVDLCVHQPRQNPVVDAATWLAEPASAAAIRNDSSHPRTFTPLSRNMHRRAFAAAHGWADVQPYYDLRELLQPNTGGGYWRLPSADCYAGIAASWQVDTWGDHSRSDGLVPELTGADRKASRWTPSPALINVLKGYGVTHVLSPEPFSAPLSLELLTETEGAAVYRVPGAQRVRLVSKATVVQQLSEAMRLLRQPEFDLDENVLLHDVPASFMPAGSDVDRRAARTAPPIIDEDTDTRVSVAVQAQSDSFLVLADTYAPGWRAEIDGIPAALYRANISVRAVRVSAGAHRVAFIYEQPGLKRGQRITAICSLLLLLWAILAWRLSREPAP